MIQLILDLLFAQLKRSLQIFKFYFYFARCPDSDGPQSYTDRLRQNRPEVVSEGLCTLCSIGMPANVGFTCYHLKLVTD